MGKDAQKIAQRIEELTERLNNNYDSKLISEIHYWRGKLMNLEKTIPKNKKNYSGIDDNFRIIK